MIALLNRTVYSGDNLNRFGIRAVEFPMHHYYTVGIRGNLEIADVIREYNVVRVTIVNGIIMASGNTQDWVWLVRLMRQSGDRANIVLADNIVAALPDVFNQPSSSALMKVT